MARVHTITGNDNGGGDQCKTFDNPRNGCTYKTCKKDGRWKIQPNPDCSKKKR